MRTILLAALLIGCAPLQTRRQIVQYSEMLIIRAEAWEVDQACDRLETRNDTGERLSRGTRCCWDQGRKQMWVSWDAVDCIPHELCHVDGQPAEACSKTHWR